ncbi:MAG: DNA polymerase I, partial [Desulfobacterales bacterium]|nr:DNA polymerase I [Desulfobacterales bacterium]NIW16701.1 DNA polymerase I [Candidatus Bathyarchaeota archaeon]
MPEDLVAQLPYIYAILKNLGLRTIEKEGYEADDVIGTLARKGEEQGYPILIVTGDKDFRQLISPKISLLDTMKDKYTDYETFTKEYGLEPVQVIDLMGLSGDSVDNIPGVPGVGEKTALELVKDFGSLEGVFEGLKEIKKKKLKENLEKSQEEAVLSKKLVAIDQHTPIDEEIEDLRVEEAKSEELSAIFRELEFKSLWEQFAVREEHAEKDYRLCLSEEDLSSLIEKIKQKGLVSIDTETTSQDPLQAELVGISFSHEEHEATYLPMAHDYEAAP